MHYERLHENFRSSLELFSTAFPFCRNFVIKISIYYEEKKNYEIITVIHYSYP